LLRYKRCGKTKTQRKDIQKRRIARKVYGKKIVWMIRQIVQPRILEKIREKLETIERKTIRGEKDGNNRERRRNRGRKIRNQRVDKRR